MRVFRGAGFVFGLRRGAVEVSTCATPRACGRRPALGMVMLLIRTLCCASLVSLGLARAQTQEPPQSAPPATLSVTSKLAFLDVTVLDKKNRPVVTGLTQDDFAITQDRQPQRIFSFEGPDVHEAVAVSPDDGAAGKAAPTAIVLDRLNSQFSEFAYSLICVRRFLLAQPEELNSPTELMLLGNRSFELLHSYTRSRAELLDVLNHLAPALPYKVGAEWFRERFVQSIDALREIALQNEGMPGRKNVLWIGPGVGLRVDSLVGDYSKMKWYVHDTTNALVDARISLFVIYPGLGGAGIDFSNLYLNPDHPSLGLGVDDPFAAEMGFAAFANETGGAVLHNNNYVDLSMKQAESYGTSFYTLTYRPPDVPADGRFRRVTVTMRDPKLHAVTKVGYYAPDEKAPFNERQQALFHIASQVVSVIPFDALQVSLESIVRHSDSNTIEVMLRLGSKELVWQAGENGTSSTDVNLASASLSKSRQILASKMEDLSIVAHSQSPTVLSGAHNRIHVTLRTPPKTEAVRVVLETPGNGRAGSIDIPRGVIDAAKDAPTPEPKLVPQPRKLEPRTVPMP